MSETREFEVGEKVEWTSQAGGYTRTKAGTVVGVLAPGQRPYEEINRLKAQYGAKDKWGGGTTRKHKSYLVLVPAHSSRSRPTLYWPRVSVLKSAEGPAEAVATG